MNEDKQMQPHDAQPQKMMRAGRWRQALPSALGILLGVAVVLLFGPNWLTFIAVAILVCAVVIVQQTFGRQSWREGEEDCAGVQECPHCGSLQTDLVSRYNRDGSEYEQLHCFACDSDIDEKLESH